MAAGTDESDDLFMSVRLHEERRLCKVLVTSQTTGNDVIELLKPDDENVYCLVEIWKGCERPVTQEEKLKNVLLQWGSDIDDVVFMLKRKPSTSRQKKSPRNSPVSDQLQDKQQKVENLEKEVQQKEKHLKSLRNKEASKSSLKTKYVKLLETRVIEQEEKLLSLQSVQDELFNTRIENENLVIELGRLRSLFVLKHQQLAEATAKVELLTRELARSQHNDVSKNNALQNERNMQHPEYISNQSEKQQLLKQQHLTQTQLLQLQANNGYNKSTINPNEPIGKDFLFLKHGILPEHNDLNGLHSWHKDEENDTETSADSGHVSDSPPYQHRFGSSFQFHQNPPEMYSGKVERFEIDQDFDIQLDNNQGGAGLYGLKGVSEVDGLSQIKGNYYSHAKGIAFNPELRPSGNLNPTQQLLVDTNINQGGVGSLFRQRQVNRNSPQSTSSISSLSSDSSKNDLIPGLHPTRLTSQTNSSLSGSVTPNNDLRDVSSARDSGSRSSTPTNERKQLNGDVNQTSSRGSKTNTPTKESKSFLPNESSTDGLNTKRTAGSISSYHRNREGSFDSSSGLNLGSFSAKERTPSLTSDSSSENSLHRVRTSSIEKPTIPNSLVITKGNDPRNGYLSPLEAKKSPNFNQSNQVKSPTITNDRSSPMVLDLKQQNPKNPNQQIINRKKSPLSTNRSIPGDPKGRSSPAVSESKSISSDRTFDTTSRSSPKVVEAKAPNSDRGFDNKTRTPSRVSESRTETSTSNTVSRPDKGGSNQAPMTSPAVQDVLNDMTTLKVTSREVKPIQIQTRAEKDSDNIPVKKTTAKNNIPVAKSPSGSQTKQVHKPPKPVPRKRTKTPPARGSGIETNIIVKSSQESVGTKSSGSNVKNARNGHEKDSKNGSLIADATIDDRLGTKAYDSILRSTKNKAGKKSVKRVSLDPHAVLLHASLEGELELVKNIIHQVEDPSYPNNEGLTALHHAVCNSHDDIVKFLIEYGCDINASDMQGWTSLHCAAANNSVDMCNYLINHGACVFAVTAIEGKTPSRCCEKDSENFHKCFAYLSDVEENFGVSNDGVVYAVYAYQATRKDELSFEYGERLTVVRRGDVNETEWWWARDTQNNFGYIPRNLLGLHPPVAPDV